MVRLFLLLMANIFCLSAAHAQAESISGVIQSPAGRESYGINDLTVLKKQTSSSGYFPYATRQHRRGNESGIGGSFIGTASPTVESSAPRIPQSIAPVVTNAISASNASQSIYGNVDKTPALYGSLNQQLFELGGEKLMRKFPMSPALVRSSHHVWDETESSLTKKPVMVIEPVEHINLHRTGGSSSLTY